MKKYPAVQRDSSDQMWDFSSGAIQPIPILTLCSESFPCSGRFSGSEQSCTGGTLDYLQILSSITRGRWLLVCEYWMSSSSRHRSGVSFENGYQSGGLAHILESVMQHQDSFVLPPDRGRQGLLQVPMPTKEESTAAAELMNEAVDGLGSLLVNPALV